MGFGVVLLLLCGWDCISLTWRAWKDEKFGAIAGVALAALTAVGTVLARCAAHALIADAIGADPHSAPNAADLLTLAFMPPCIAWVACSVIPGIFLLLATQATKFALSFLLSLTPERIQQMVWLCIGVVAAQMLWNAIKTHSVQASRGTQSQPIVARCLFSARLFVRTGARIIRPIAILFASVIGFMFLTGSAADSSQQLTASARTFALMLDFRRGAECINLRSPHAEKQTRIASIPNVDDAVLVARVSVSDQTFMVRDLIGLPDMEDLMFRSAKEPRKRVPVTIAITRERCERPSASISALP